MKEKIIEGLMKLDVQNDNHWTADGLPKIDALKFSVGPTITREEVNSVAPNFCRSNPQIEEVQDEHGLSNDTQETEPTQVVDASFNMSIESEGPEETVASPTEGHIESGTISELKIRVNCDVDYLFKYLAQDLPDVNIQLTTDEELARLEEELRHGMTADNVLLSAVNQLITERNRMHEKVVTELEHRKPKAHLANQLASFRNSMAECQHVVNQPRMMVRNGIKTR